MFYKLEIDLSNPASFYFDILPIIKKHNGHATHLEFDATGRLIHATAVFEDNNDLVMCKLCIL